MRTTVPTAKLLVLATATGADARILRAMSQYPNDDPGHPPAWRDARVAVGLVVGGLIGVTATVIGGRDLGWPDLGDLPGTIWVAFITTSALVLQGWLTARREERLRIHDREERAQDRQVETYRREQERADALNERWRDERKQAHADLLEAYSLAMDSFRAATSKAGLGRLLRYSNEDLKPVQAAAAEAHVRVEKQLAVVHLLASTSAADAADAAVARLRGVWMIIMSFDLYEDESNKRDEAAKQAEERMTTVYAVRDAYRNAARQDIGTT